VSDTLAIGAVTAALRNLLQKEVTLEDGGVQVTTLPPDKAGTFGQLDGEGKGRINLFLYQTQISAAWRNMDPPRQVKPNESGNPSLPLDLYYLVTAYEKTDGDASVLAHRLLGRAMLILHDHPLLGAAEIANFVPKSELANQIERVRITPHPMSLEDLSKLWMIFQTGYRISAAYQVSLVLIDSRRATRTPLPVLTRGEDDSGVVAQGDLIPPFPAIEDIRLVDPADPNNLLPMKQRLSFELGDKIAILGHHFGLEEGDMTKVTLTVRFDSLRLDKPQDVPVLAADATDERITISIPNVPPGSYTVSVLIVPNGKPEATRATNEWPLLLAPKITSATPLPAVALTNVVDGCGNATINLTCAPDVLPPQRVTLMLGDLPVPAEPRAAKTDPLVFKARNIGAGDFRVRLRVDGVDSHFIDFTDPKKPFFIESQKVTIT
jgi:hypothetical protein